MTFKMSLPRQGSASALPRPKHKPPSTAAWVWFILSLALSAVLLYVAAAVALVGAVYQDRTMVLIGIFFALGLLAELAYKIVKFVRRTRID